MSKLINISLILSVGLLSGCLANQNPLPTTENNYEQSVLNGIWIEKAAVNPDSRKSITIFPDPVHPQFIILEGTGKIFQPEQLEEAKAENITAGAYGATIHRHHQDYFASLKTLRGEENSPGYFVIKFKVNRDDLWVWFMPQKNADRLVRNSGQRTLVIDEEETGILKMTSKQFARFVHAIPAEEFGQPTIYERYPPGRPTAATSQDAPHE